MTEQFFIQQKKKFYHLNEPFILFIHDWSIDNTFGCKEYSDIFGIVFLFRRWNTIHPLEQ